MVHSPFHRDRLGGLDVDQFREADLPSLPTMTKNRGACDLERIRGALVAIMEKAGLDLPRVTVERVPSLDRMWSGKLKQFEPLTG